MAKKKIWRVLVAAAASVMLWAGLAPVATVSAATTTTSSVAIGAKAAIAIDAKTGKVLYDKNANTALPIASMTKMIGIYLVLEAIKNGKLKWTDTLTPDSAVYKISQNTKLSNVPLLQDGKYTVKELYQASLIYSANAAMMLLGNGVAGTQSKFIDDMNAKLKSWGITDATIVNATGLDNSDLTVDRYPGSTSTDQNTMSAKDVAIVARHLVNDFPSVLKTTSIAKKTFRAGTSDATDMENWDWMLKGLVSAQSDLPVDGLKTGTTDRAGQCFTGTVKKNGMRIITVVLHAGSNDGSTTRFKQTATLMRYVFNNWTTLKVTTKGKGIGQHTSVTVDKGKQTSVKIAANKSVTLVVPTGTTKSDVQYQYTAAKGVTKNTISAPSKKNMTVGTVKLSTKGDNLGYVDGRKTDNVQLKTTKAVGKANFFVLIFRGIGSFFGNLF